MFPDPCLSWLWKRRNGDKLKSAKDKPEDRPSELHFVRPRTLETKTKSKVEAWLDTATLIIDPSDDIELGLNLPLDIYMSRAEGSTKHAGIFQ